MKPHEKRKKLDAKSLECILLGFAENRKAFTCLHRSTGQIFESRDVVFDENDPAGPDRVKIMDDPATAPSEVPDRKLLDSDRISIEEDLDDVKEEPGVEGDQLVQFWKVYPQQTHSAPTGRQKGLLHSYEGRRSLIRPQYLP